MVESKYAFSRFLRKMHDENILKQVIPNVEVDTSNKCMYQWRFYPPTKTRQRQADPESVKATFHLSKGMFFARGMTAVISTDQVSISTNQFFVNLANMK